MFRAAIVFMSLLAATPALAQTQAQSQARAQTEAQIQTAAPPVESQAFRTSIRTLRFDTTQGARRSPSAPVMRRAGKMGTGERIGWTALAGLGGFFAGGYIGAAIEGDRCNCDDPGLMGALIGMPVGTAAAAITTWVLTGR